MGECPVSGFMFTSSGLHLLNTIIQDLAKKTKQKVANRINAIELDKQFLQEFMLFLDFDALIIGELFM